MQSNWKQDISEWINVGETELWRRKDGPAEVYFGILPWMGRASTGKDFGIFLTF